MTSQPLHLQGRCLRIPLRDGGDSTLSTARELRLRLLLFTFGLRITIGDFRRGVYRFWIADSSERLGLTVADDWNRESYPMKKDPFGVFEVLVPAKDGQPAIAHNSKIKVSLQAIVSTSSNFIDLHDLTLRPTN